MTGIGSRGIRARSFGAVVAVVVVLLLAPVGSQAAGAGVYAVNGTLQIVPRSNEGPGSWTLTASVRLTTGAANMPKVGTLRASGPILGSAPKVPAGMIGPTDPVLASGNATVSWSNVPPTRAVVVMVKKAPRVTVTGVVNKGSGRYGVIVLPLKVTGNNITGRLILVASGTIDK